MFSIKIDLFEGIPRVGFTGELVSGPACHALADVVDQLVDVGEVHVMVDLLAMHRIDSAGLGALIHGHERLSTLGGTFVVVRPSLRLCAILARTRLSGLLMVADSARDAINLLGRRFPATGLRPGLC